MADEKKFSRDGGSKHNRTKQVRRLGRQGNSTTFKFRDDHTEDQRTICPALVRPDEARIANDPVFLSLRVAPAFRKECSATDKMSAPKISCQREMTALHHSNPHDRTAARRGSEMAHDTFFTLRKMPLDRVVDLSRADLISCDTDPNRQTGSRIREGFQVDPHVLSAGKF